MKATHLKNTISEKQTQRLAFPVYDEEDILNWDAAIVPASSRRSGTTGQVNMPRTKQTDLG